MDGVVGGDEMFHAGQDGVRVAMGTDMLTTYVPVDCC